MPKSDWKQKDWLKFEHEVTALVEAFGYSATTTKPSHDQGIDVVAEHSRRKVIVQCKLYTRGSVGAPAILQLIGSRSLEKADDAICVTTSRFTREARKVAEQEVVRLIDRDMLVELCKLRRLSIPSLTYLRRSRDCHPTDCGPISIGREGNNTIVLSDPRISRRHVEFRRAGLRLQVVDLSSSNGTWVNLERLTRPRDVTYGDVIRLGNTTLDVTLLTKSDQLGPDW